MSINTFGHLFRVTTWGESHGEAIGATIDGCPPGIEITQNYIQHFMEKRRPGQSKYTTQRREMDLVEILSGVFENKSTGTPIQLLIKILIKDPKTIVKLKIRSAQGMPI